MKDTQHSKKFIIKYFDIDNPHDDKTTITLIGCAKACTEYSEENGIRLLAWLIENYFQRMPNGFARRDDDRPRGFQRLYTIHELVKLFNEQKSGT